MESTAVPKTHTLTLRDVNIPAPYISGPMSENDASYKELVKFNLLSLEAPLSVSNFAASLKKRDLKGEFNILYQVCDLDSHNSRMNKDPNV